MTTAQTKHQMSNDDTEHQLVQHYVLNTLFFCFDFLVKWQEIIHSKLIQNQCRDQKSHHVNHFEFGLY